MQPERVLIIDVGHLHNNVDHANKRTYLDRYPNPMICRGWMPSVDMLCEFLRGLDVVFTCETTYSPHLVPIAHSLGVRVVVQPNWEFLDLSWPQPDLWASPSLWHYDELPENKTYLPVPIATDRFSSSVASSETATHFLHVVGRPAHADRNGTADLLQALQYVTAEVVVDVRCQKPGYVSGLVNELGIRTPGNVTFRVDSADVDNYWDLYQGDVLLMPRRFGGLCLPVNEALGAGMPVIMPDISPNNTWLPNEWLIPAGWQTSFMAKQHVDVYGSSRTDLAAIIDRFATDQGFYIKAQDEATRLRDEISWHTLKPRYMEVLGNL
jgi:glycosyltransferase involved in cell wall biosynthesis